MLVKTLGVLLLASASLCQPQEQSRRLRFRRPRPKLVEVSNPEGELQGAPVPLIQDDERRSSSRGLFNRPSSGNDALNALIATATKEDRPTTPVPQQLDIQEIPTQTPLILEQQEEVDLRPLAPQRPSGGRNRGGIPRRRNKPVATLGGEGSPRGRPLDFEEEREPVATIERYSKKNEDGSFTFGYISADGSFKEETRGADCITRGKYGYIDPEGVKREYSYTAGLPCEIGEEGENALQDEDGSVLDTVDPAERFRQTANVQLSEDEIPARPAIKQRIRQRPQVAPAPEAPAQAAFANFGNQGGRAQIPQRRPVPTRTGGAASSALDSLLNIAEGSAAAAAPAVPASRPRPRPAAPANPGTFDFDSELEGFTLNRPALSFEKSQGAGSGASFQSQLVFDQNTGTFQTELRQAGQPDQANAAAPFTRTTAAPATTINASPRPTTAFKSAPTPAAGVRPAGTFTFEPLTFPPVPAPTPAAPAPATVRLPAPTPAAPRPTTVLTPAPTSKPPTAAPARPTGAAPANTFFVFQPFNQQGVPAPSPQPASAPFSSAFNPNAFQIRPAQQQQPAAGAPLRPNPFPQPIPFPQRAAPTAAAPTPAAVAATAAPTPAAAAAASPAPVQQFRQPAPVPSQGFQQARPQLQFGFQPVQQQQARPAPFTAFRSGPPPQIQALQQQPQQLRQQPQLGVPPQLQQGQRFAPPATRPQPFSVFGQAPQAFRGA